MPDEVRNIKNIIIITHALSHGGKESKKKGNRDRALRKATDLRDFLSPCHWFEDRDHFLGYWNSLWCLHNYLPSQWLIEECSVSRTTANNYPSCQFLIIRAICLDGPLAQHLQPQEITCREVTYHRDWLVFSIQYRRSYIVLAKEVQGWGVSSFPLLYQSKSN